MGLPGGRKPKLTVLLVASLNVEMNVSFVGEPRCAKRRELSKKGSRVFGIRMQSQVVDWETDELSEIVSASPWIRNRDGGHSRS